MNDQNAAYWRWKPIFKKYTTKPSHSHITSYADTNKPSQTLDVNLKLDNAFDVGFSLSHLVLYISFKIKVGKWIKILIWFECGDSFCFFACSIFSLSFEIFFGVLFHLFDNVPWQASRGIESSINFSVNYYLLNSHLTENVSLASIGNEF
jgi:hypothetical protein